MSVMEDSPGMRKGKKENHLKTILDIALSFCVILVEGKLSRNEIIFHASEKPGRNR